MLRELLPTAAQLTTGELIDAIAKLAIALHPEWVRRRYERALKARRVVGTRNPDGTATLTGHDLLFDEVAAACARLDALAHAAKTAGHPDRLDHLRADLLVGMITGRYTAMTDQQILATLHATIPTKPDTTTSPADDTDTSDTSDTSDDTSEGDTSEGDASDGDALGGGHPGGAGAGGDNRDGSDRGPPGGSRSRLGRRGGLRLWAGLLTSPTSKPHWSTPSYRPVPFPTSDHHV